MLSLITCIINTPHKLSSQLNRFGCRRSFRQSPKPHVEILSLEIELHTSLQILNPGSTEGLLRELSSSAMIEGTQINVLSSNNRKIQQQQLLTQLRGEIT